jgi:hypothetical protein
MALCPGTSVPAAEVDVPQGADFTVCTDETGTDTAILDKEDLRISFSLRSFEPPQKAPTQHFN